MLNRYIMLILLISLLPCHVFSQASSEWHKRYGAPESERYIIHDGVSLTVFYAGDNRTCKAILVAEKPETPSNFEKMLTQIIPISERGAKIRSVGLSSGANGIGSTDYERVRISLATSAEASNTTQQKTSGNVVSATILWNGVQCRTTDH